MSNRFKDVLLALRATKSHPHNIGRLQLQKLIYISDVLAPIWRRFSGPACFIPYKNGPYDPAIQNAVDSLVFRNLVVINRLNIRNIKQMETQYVLSTAGEEVVRLLIEGTVFQEDLELYESIVAEIEVRGWLNIKTLVYAEPTYEFAKSSGRGGKLRLDQTNHNLSSAIIKQFENAFFNKIGRVPSRRQLIQMYFTFLDEYLAMPQATFDQE